MKRIEDEQQLEAVLASSTALLYKHSPICGVSSLAIRQVRRFLDEFPEMPGFMIDVVEQRRLARIVEERLGVPHKSPQVIFVRDGKAIWSKSHAAIRAKALTQQLESSA